MNIVNTMLRSRLLIAVDVLPRRVVDIFRNNCFPLDSSIRLSLGSFVIKNVISLHLKFLLKSVLFEESWKTPYRGQRRFHCYTIEDTDYSIKKPFSTTENLLKSVEPL